MHHLGRHEHYLMSRLWGQVCPAPHAQRTVHRAPCTAPTRPSPVCWAWLQAGAVSLPVHARADPTLVLSSVSPPASCHASTWRLPRLLVTRGCSAATTCSSTGAPWAVPLWPAWNNAVARLCSLTSRHAHPFSRPPSPLYRISHEGCTYPPPPAADASVLSALDEEDSE